jgi:hypothetical protein
MEELLSLRDPCNADKRMHVSTATRRSATGARVKFVPVKYSALRTTVREFMASLRLEELEVGFKESVATGARTASTMAYTGNGATVKNRIPPAPTGNASARDWAKWESDVLAKIEAAAVAAKGAARTSVVQSSSINNVGNSSCIVTSGGAPRVTINGVEVTGLSMGGNVTVTGDGTTYTVTTSGAGQPTRRKVVRPREESDDDDCSYASDENGVIDLTKPKRRRSGEKYY